MNQIHLPDGFQYAGIHCGIRPEPDRLDLALVVSDAPAHAAGVFTQNRVAAAPVRVSRERVPRADARGIVICSGNANACTGDRGLEDARQMTRALAETLACREEQVLVCSTGVIGRHLPMTQVEDGISRGVAELGSSVIHFELAAKAILTTDTCSKISSRKLRLRGKDFAVTGFAKGAAMIGPNMATMLAFVLTDAPVAPRDLMGIASRTAERSFNRVTVDGHTSTNDSLIYLANGFGQALREDEVETFEEEALSVCTDLARKIAEDAEGAKHLVTVEVDGLRDDEEARRVARAVADSLLVKTAIFGGDPNWGRIVSAAGYAGVAFDEEHLSLWIGDILLYQSGTPQSFNPATASAYLKSNRNVSIRLRFTLGPGKCTLWTCDLTYDYVRLNAEYTT